MEGNFSRVGEIDGTYWSPSYKGYRKVEAVSLKIRTYTMDIKA